MKVKELVELLKQCDQEAEVIMSSDGEGNSFSPLADIGPDHKYEPDSTWSGTVYNDEDYAELVEDFLEDEKTLLECVVLWPTN